MFQSLLPQTVPTDSEASHVSVLGRLLLLLGRRNQDPVMREMVCDYLRDHLTEDEWILFCPQLVQALKWDLLPNNALIRHLLCQALRDRSFAYNLYWQLQVRGCGESTASSNSSNPVFRIRFRSYLEILLRITDTLKVIVGTEVPTGGRVNGSTCSSVN